MLLALDEIFKELDPMSPCLRYGVRGLFCFSRGSDLWASTLGPNGELTRACFLRSVPLSRDNDTRQADQKFWFMTHSTNGTFVLSL
jgi:hypothetical protein